MTSDISNRGRLRSSFYAFVFTGLAASCSGGGGGSSTSAPPPPPPPPANTAPSIQFTVSDDVVLEQNQFVIDASESSDTQDSFEISMQQVSGPTAERLEDVNSTTTRWRAASIDDDTSTDMQFEITATDARGASSSVTATIPVRSFSGPGKPIAIFDPGITLAAGNVGGLTEVIGYRTQIAGSANNPLEVLLFGEDTGNQYFSYRRSDRVLVRDTFSNISSLQVGALSFNLQGGLLGEHFVVLNELDNELSLYTSQSTSLEGEFTKSDSIDIDNPCYITGRRDTSQDFIWTGQRNFGFSVVEIQSTGTNTFDDTVRDQINNGRSFCHIFPTTLPERLSQVDPFENSNFSDLIAVDYDSNELVLYGDTDEDQTYNELEIVPIEMPSSANLTIVDIFSYGTPNQLPRYMAILMRDDDPSNRHQLVIVAQDRDDMELSQTVYDLPSDSPPIALIDGTFVGTPAGDQLSPDIVVVTRNSGAFVLEYTAPDAATSPTFLAPNTFDTGTGAASAVTAESEDFLEQVVLISYPESGELRVFKPREEID